jgi:ABC-2 type transport system permease protein
MAKSEKHFMLFRLAFVHALKNYKALIGMSLFLITCLLIFAHLWKIASVKTGAFNLRPDELLWYIAFNEWVIIAIPDVQVDMEMDLRSGRLAYLLPRPISYLWSTFAEAAGALSANLLISGIVAFTFTWLRVGGAPFSPTAFAWMIVIGCAAGILCIIFRMLIGITAFWMQEVDPFFWIWEKLFFALGGLILPLSTYPGWLEAIARLTPFPAILGDRSALAFDFNLSAALSVTATLISWGAATSLLLLFLYKRGLRIVNIEGG